MEHNEEHESWEECVICGSLLTDEDIRERDGICGECRQEEYEDFIQRKDEISDVIENGRAE